MSITSVPISRAGGDVALLPPVIPSTGILTNDNAHNLEGTCNHLRKEKDSSL